ncbi:MAG: hypothetical protein VX246_14740 [Myxococcota bacterium]|nr:hypothetical protein [Myxococcota bacterium]
MARHTLVVLTNAAPGKHDEFNKWYDEVHLRDVVGLDGFVAAQRFRLAERQIMEDRSFEYLAIYEIECEDINKALDALNAGSQNMVISDSLAEGAKAIAFSAIGERYEPDAD